MASGDLGIWRDATGGTNFNSTTPTDLTFGSQVQAEGDFSAAAGAAINLPAGKVLAIYNLGFRTPTGSNRSCTTARLNLAGSASAYGLSSGYIRRSGGSDESYQAASAILDVASAGDDLIVQVARTDSNTGVDCDTIADVSSIQLIELDDTWNYFRAKFSGSTTSIAVNTGNPVTLPLTNSTNVDFDEAADEKDTGFTHAEATTPEQITCPKELLLVCYGVRGLNSSTSARRNMVTWIELDGTRLDHTYATTYLRGSNGVQEGWCSWVGLIDVSGATTGNLVVKAAIETESGSSGCTYTDGYITIAELPSAAAWAWIENNAAHTSFPNVTPAQLTLDTEAQLDTDAFSHPTNPELSADNAGNYLFLGGFAYDRSANDATRQTPQMRWYLDGTAQTRGQFANFSRGDQGSTSTHAAAQSGGYILRSEDTGDRDVEIRVITEETNSQEAGRFQAGHVWLQGLELASLFTGGGAVDVDGTAAVVSGQASDLAATRDVDSTAAVTSGQSSDLGATRALGSTASAASGTSADLDGGRNVETTSAAASDHQADVSIARDGTATAPAVSTGQGNLGGGRSLDSTVAAVTGSAVSLRASRAVVGTAAAVSSASGDLDTAGQALLDGTAAALSGQSSSLDAGRGVDGAASSISDQQSDAVVARDHNGTSPAISTASGELTVTRGMDGNAVVLSDCLTPSLLVTRRFFLSAAAVSGASAELQLQGQANLNGTAAALSGHQADMGLQRELQATSAWVTTASGAVDRQPVLSSTAAAVSGSQATFEAVRNLIADAPVIAGHQAELDVTAGATLLDGAAVAVSGHQAALARTATIAATAQTVSGASPFLARLAALDALATILSGADADLASTITPTTYLDLEGDLDELIELGGLVVAQIDLAGGVIARFDLEGGA